MSTLISVGLLVVIGAILAVFFTRTHRDQMKFVNSRREGAAARPDPVLARSSAGEVADAGPYDWSSVLQALAVPSGEEVPDRTGEDIYGSELGLRTIIVTGGAHQPDVMFGSRLGRGMEIRLGRDEKIATFDTTTRHLREITIVGAHCPSFALRGRDARLIPEADAPPQALEVLSALAPAEIWNGIRVVAGEDGLVANRPMSSSAYGWVYDLWLLERLADRLKAAPRAAPKPWPHSRVPYGMGSWTA